MPTYQYACRECGHAFEQVQSFSDDTLTVCPECEGRLRKVFNAVGVVFKGSGFYRTDSRKKESSSETSRPRPRPTPRPPQPRRPPRRRVTRLIGLIELVGLLHDGHEVSPADRQLRVLHSPAARG